FASGEAINLNIHSIVSTTCAVSKPNQQGGLVLAAAPLVKAEYGVKTGTRVYDIPKDTDIKIVEPRMALYLKKNIEILNIFRRYVMDKEIGRASCRERV